MDTRKSTQAGAFEGFGEIRRNEPLSEHSTWRIGGPADVLVEPGSAEQLCRLLRYIHDHEIVSIIIGRGSNLLFDDAGLRGVVVKMGRPLSRINVGGTLVRAEAGVAMPRLARAVGSAGLTGLEHTVGIPGTLGGLIVMNGGSGGENIGDVVAAIDAVDRSGELHRKDRDECGFGYRRSAFQELDWVLLSAQLRLDYGDPRAIRQRMLEILRQRRRKFPRDLPSCGSVFLSGGRLHDQFGPPGKVIEEAGLKGLTVGGAQVSQKHANFIVNTGDAAAADVQELIRRVRRVVHRRTAIWMDCEVRYVSPMGEIRPLHEVL